ncbi:MAG: metal-sensing transcriptional repressor [Planctomycetia bacterium]|nr:metal-sensing transcriptional repressor [Planctomycetia bacterium]
MRHAHRHTRRTEADRRLSRIAGHVEAIRRMIRADRDCPELLVQIAAVRAALRQVGLVVLKDHISACLGSSHRRAVPPALAAALDRFLK